MIDTKKHKGRKQMNIINNLSVEANTVNIQLTKNMTATVSLDDYDKISDYKWYYNSTGENTGYACAMHTNDEGDRKAIYMHRFIAEPEEGFKVDHINGDTLDNRPENLRQVTTQQNAYNRRKHANNTSGYKGVCFHKRRGKYQAKISKDRVHTYLGYYDTAIEANAAYQAAAAVLYGEFNRKDANKEISTNQTH